VLMEEEGCGLPPRVIVELMVHGGARCCRTTEVRTRRVVCAAIGCAHLTGDGRRKFRASQEDL